MSKKATIIAVVNQKGGTGKTTTTENLGVGLALEGKKVLLVDTDPQASLTVSLGNPCPDDLSPTLSDLMGKIMMENPITPDEGILHHPEGVDLVPSNIELSGMEVALVNAMSRETILRQYLDTVKQNYDYILLDCMPSLGMLTVNALAAADNVLIMVSLAPIPFSTFANREQNQIGQNYLRSLFALGFQGFLIIICVGIYAVLVQSLAFTDDIIADIWGIMGYTVLLCFTLFKTGTLAKSVFNAH